MSGLQDDEVLEPQVSDATLILGVRNGSSSAYGLLYERHVDSALATAGRYAGNRSDASDLVAEAFANVLQALQNGKGPDVFFRAYLLTTLRRLAAAKRNADEKLFVLDDLELVAPAVPAANTAVIAFENETVARSFRNLPERWQLVLWHTEIDGLAPSAVAPMLGMSANAVSALAVRAREGLKQAYLQNHLSGTGTPGCEKYADQLGAYARHGLTARRTKIVQSHVDGCLKCTEKLLYLEDVGVGMRAIIFPALLGLAFSGKGVAIVGGGLGLGLKLGAGANGTGTAGGGAGAGGAGAGAAGVGAAGAGAAGAAAAGLGLPAISALVAASVAALVMVGGVVAAAVGMPLFGGPSEEPAALPQTGSAVTQVAGELPAAAGATRKAAASASPPAVALDDPANLPPAGLLLPPAAAPPLDYAGSPDPGPLPSQTAGPVAEPSATVPTSEATPQPTSAPASTNPTPRPTAEPSPTTDPTLTPTPTPTLMPSATPTISPTAVPTPTPSAEPSPTTDPTLTPTPTLTSSPTPTPSPTAVPTPTPSAEPTSDPTVAPTPTSTSSATPSPDPTVEPTDEPSAEPTEEPTAAPTDDATVEPTIDPTAEPTEEPPLEKTQFSVETTDLAANGNGARLQIDLTASGSKPISAPRVAFSSSSWLLHLGLAVQAPSGWTCSKSAILAEPEWVCTVESWAGETSSFVLTRSNWIGTASLTMRVGADESEDFSKKLRF